MNTPTITFTPSTENSANGQLCIPGVCSLQELYTHPQCPPLVKETLEKHVTWQMRSETPLHRALNLKNQYLAFRAAMAVYNAADIDEEEDIILELGNCATGSSMVRPTPAHTPIVSAFAHIQYNENTIQKCHVAITGIEKRRISLLDTSSLIGKNLTPDLIANFAKQASDTFTGFDDINGTAEYRKAMVAVTLERALQEANHG